MPTCIICHLDMSSTPNGIVVCPNGHAAHENCFKEWFLHSKNCPLCHEPYGSEVLRKYELFIRQKEKEIQEEENKIIHQKKIKKIEVITDRIRFLKFVEAIDFMIEKKQYSSAIAMLNSYKEELLTSQQKQMLLFLRGKLNYLRQKYDLAIGTLFKLVKEKFDYPEAFLYLGKAYKAIGLNDKAKWAFERAK